MYLKLYPPASGKPGIIIPDSVARRHGRLIGIATNSRYGWSQESIETSRFARVIMMMPIGALLILTLILWGNGAALAAIIVASVWALIVITAFVTGEYLPHVADEKTLRQYPDERTTNPARARIKFEKKFARYIVKDDCEAIRALYRECQDLGSTRGWIDSALYRRILQDDALLQQYLQSSKDEAELLEALIAAAGNKPSRGDRARIEGLRLELRKTAAMTVDVMRGRVDTERQLARDKSVMTQAANDTDRLSLRARADAALGRIPDRDEV